MAVTLELDDDEALVLFEWLVRTDESPSPPPVNHEAERLVLWALEGRLEKQLRQQFSPDYKKLLDAARKRLVERGGEPA